MQAALQGKASCKPVCVARKFRSAPGRVEAIGATRRHKLQDVARGRLEVSCASQRSDDEGLDGGARGGDGARVPDSLPLAGAGTDWREFRAQLVASAAQQQQQQQQAQQEGPSGAAPVAQGGAADPGGGVWAHPIPQPEKGCLLIAHPLMFTSTQVYFSQAVIFLFDHGEAGSAGIILNRRTSYNMGSLQGADMLCPEFADNVLNLGGDVGSDMLHVLHPHGDVRSVVEVVNGVFMGSPEGALESVRSGQHPACDFRWFTRYAGWAPGQLQHECRAGVWFTAAAGRGVILPSPQETGRSTWHRVLELMGGEYADLSRSVRETSLPDARGAPPPGSSDLDAGPQ